MALLIHYREKQNDLNARDEDQAVHKDKPHGVQVSFDWLIRCCHCAVNGYPEEYRLPMPLPVPPDDIQVGEYSGNDREWHSTTHFKDDYQDSLPAASSTAAAIIAIRYSTIPANAAKC